MLGTSILGAGGMQGTHLYPRSALSGMVGAGDPTGRALPSLGMLEESHMAGLGVSVGHRFSFPRDTCGMAGLGRLPHATQSSKNKSQAGVGLLLAGKDWCQGSEPPQ